MEGIDLFAEIEEEQIVSAETCPQEQLSPSTGTITEPRRASDRAGFDGPSYSMWNAKTMRAIDTAVQEPSEEIVILPPVQIPMPGGPSNFETADIIKSPFREPTPVGIHRYSLMNADEVVLERVTLTQLLGAIRNVRSERERRQLSICADGTNYVPFAIFSKLTELDLINAGGELPSGAYRGELDDSSVAAIFGRIFEHKSTGRLVMLTPFGDRNLRTEVQVIRGMPTHVASSEGGFEFPSQLIRYRLLDGEDMRAGVHSAVATQRPFSKVIGQRLGIDVGKLAVRFAGERLEPLAGSFGSYAFCSSTPDRTKPIARSLLPFLPGMYRRGITLPKLRSLVRPFLKHTFLRTLKFERYLPELRLSSVEAYAVTAFGYTRTLDQAIQSISDERFALAMAHLLIELGMIAPSN